jgi:hypothetical protein
METNLSAKKFLLIVGISISTAFMLTSCGGEPESESDDDVIVTTPGPSGPTGYGGSGPTGPSGGSGPTGGSGPSGGTGPGDDGSAPPIEYSFELNGTTAQAVFTTDAIDSDSIFRVRITAGAAGPLVYPGYSNWSLPYGCVKYTVTVNGRSVVTNMLKVEGEDNYLCPDAKSSQVIDFSDRLGGPSGVTVRVSNPMNDWKCQLWDSMKASSQQGWGPDPYWVLGPRSLNCVLKPKYSTHTETGSLRIQVNGTKAP